MKDAAFDPAMLDALADTALGPAADAASKALYARYLRTLALLCECAPYVDDPDYAELIDEVLDDACQHYPLHRSDQGEHREIAPRCPPAKT